MILNLKNKDWHKDAEILKGTILAELILVDTAVGPEGPHANHAATVGSESSHAQRQTETAQHPAQAIRKGGYP